MPRALHFPKWPLGGHPHGSWYVAVDLRRDAIGQELGDETGRDAVRGDEECECTVVFVCMAVLEASERGLERAA